MCDSLVVTAGAVCMCDARRRRRVYGLLETIVWGRRQRRLALQFLQKDQQYQRDVGKDRVDRTGRFLEDGRQMSSMWNPGMWQLRKERRRGDHRSV
jgi:hypothetical protein